MYEKYKDKSLEELSNLENTLNEFVIKNTFEYHFMHSYFQIEDDLHNFLRVKTHSTLPFERELVNYPVVIKNRSFKAEIILYANFNLKWTNPEHTKAVYRVTPEWITNNKNTLCVFANQFAEERHNEYKKLIKQQLKEVISFKLKRL